jgi:hypothetical protein
MVVSAYTQSLLKRLRELLPLSEDEIIQRGITQATTTRIIELRQRGAELASIYNSPEKLSERIQSEGIPVDDHSLYTDLLEWRSVKYELAQLTGFLEEL